jgi:hypothetical protein
MKKSSKVASMVLVCVMCCASLAWAKMPKLVPTKQNGATFMMPEGWSVKSTMKPVPQVQMEEKPGSPTSPSIHISNYPLQYGANTASLHAQNVVASSFKKGTAKMLSRDAGMNNSTAEVWQGTIGEVEGKMAIVYYADTARGFGMTAIFAAPPKRFDAMGGAKLVYAVLGADGKTPVKSVADRPKARALSIPKKYRSSKTPTLFYIAENFHQLSPAQVARGFRMFNQTELQLLGVYSAFANLLHGIACGADASLVLSTGGPPQSCQTTMAQWQQTLQLTQGNKMAALEYALRQRETFLIGARCSTGGLDKSSCNIYVQARREDIDNSHNTMMRVIANLSNGCIVGDPGCLPY